MATAITNTQANWSGPELATAFAEFTAAADSLERCYAQVQGEVLRLREELENAHRELARSQALAEVTTLLAHEVRNPLASLELFAGLLADARLPGDTGEWVDYLQAGLRALTLTVNNVLHFHGDAPPPTGAVDLGEWLDWARGFLRPMAAQCRVKLEVQNRLRGIRIRGDLHRLQQVLLNLAVNASRAMPEGGTLTMSGRSRGSQGVEIGVRDTGCGIPVEHRSRIFAPGFSTRAEGPGLGLAVCARILEAHHAQLRVVSVCGRGTRFALRFPAEVLL